MRQFLFLVAIIYSFFLEGKENFIFRITADSEPNAIVGNSVNALSGEFFWVEYDIASKRIGGMNFTRVYDSGSILPNAMGYAWGSNFAKDLMFFDYKDKQRLVVAGNAEHDLFPFYMKEEENRLLGKAYEGIFKIGYTNSIEAELMGEPSFSRSEAICHEFNNKKKENWWEIKLPNGTSRIYEKKEGKEKYKNCTLYRYRIIKENLPNGHVRHFSYQPKTGSIHKISVTNTAGTRELDSLTFSYGKKEQRYERTVQSASGETIHYQVEPVLINYTFPETIVYSLTTSEASHFPSTNYQSSYFDQGNDSYQYKIRKVCRPQGRGLGISYYDNIKDQLRFGKVKALMAPLGQKGEYVPVYEFDYFKDRTEVSDPFKNKTLYCKEENRLSKIIQGNYRAFQYKWDLKGNLISKGLQTSDGFTKKCLCFLYDAAGNPVQKICYGNITGNAQDVFCIDKNGFPSQKTDQAVHRFEYSNDGMNLKTKEILPNGTSYEYHYKPNTNLITKRFTIAAGKIHQREFFNYDENSILVESIEDDGCQRDPQRLDDATYRLITEIKPELNVGSCGYTLPKTIIYSYQDLNTKGKILLKREELTYTTGDLIADKRVYDAAGVYSHSYFFEYNPHGKVIREVNPAGIETLFRYDANDNLISSEGSGKKTFYKYDKGNRLIEERVECEGVSLTTCHSYDLLGNLLHTTDPYGAFTLHDYDPYSREIVSTDSLGNTTIKDYDIADNVVKVTDKEGNATLKKYNINGDPLEILYPDGTKERFEYLLNGNLLKKWEKDGTFSCYEYEYNDRVVREATYDRHGSFLREQKRRYKGKHLIAEIDWRGIETIYKYDFAGRLVCKKRQDVEEYYTYDSLSRIHKTTKGDLVEILKYDPLDRVIEERSEDKTGKLFRRKTYAYDARDNKISEKIFTDASQCSENKTIYNGLNYPILKEDSLGNRTHYHYDHGNCFQTTATDPLGQETLCVYDSQRQLTEKEISFKGELCSRETYEYSPNGNKVRQINSRVKDGKVQDSYILEWHYDSMGQVTAEMEQGEKITQTTYFQGRKATIIKPDGISLHHTYDPLGRLTKLTSSDGSVSYSYSYDAADNLLCIEDLVHHTVHRRTYDAHNRLLSEELPNGHVSSFTYDKRGRQLTMALPDGSLISYQYNPTDLISVKRGEKTHSYFYDLAGNIKKEISFHGDEIVYLRDLNQRIISIFSPLFSQTVSYDAAGNVTRTITNGMTINYSYDPLYQLTKETGVYHHVYTYDSLNNRLTEDSHPYTHNDLQQLLSNGRDVYAYDLNGNRIAKNQICYKYDALNRLIEADGICYTYDSFGRLMTRNEEAFFYCQNVELGTLKTFRLMGSGTVGIEKEGRLYSVIKDYRGSITAITDQSRNLVGSYDYNAFGEAFHKDNFDSPWQFFAQRVDPQTHLIHFAKRVYDPSIGKWLTPDPSGFADGPNLYAYVHNNPLASVDPYGLWGESLYSWYQHSKQFSKSFTRGFIDDTTFGASSYMLGTYHHDSFASKFGYYTGTGCSMAAGLAYGSTWLKGAQYTGKAVANIYKAGRTALIATETTKSVIETRSIIKLAQEASPLTTRIEEIAAKHGYIVPKERFAKPLPQGHIWQKASPFRNKTAQDLDQMFRSKGFEPRGVDCISGRGNYINPKNGRLYHIDPKDAGRYREPNHVDVGRSEKYSGTLMKKRFGYIDD